MSERATPVHPAGLARRPARARRRRYEGYVYSRCTAPYDKSRAYDFGIGRSLRVRYVLYVPWVRIHVLYVPRARAPVRASRMRVARAPRLRYGTTVRVVPAQLCDDRVCVALAASRLAARGGVADDGARAIMATLAGKDALLHWCQERTAPYRRCGISVENFATSFQDGRAFVALVHSQWPSSIASPETLSAEDARTNLDLAFGVAESFGVFKLLDADLIATSGKPEPKTVMTYLAELRKQIRKYDGSEKTQEPSRSKSMPGMRVVAVSASDDVASLLADVDLSTLKRPSRPRAQTTAAPAKPRAETAGPPAIPKQKKKAVPPAIPKQKKKAVIPGRVVAGAQVGGAAVQQSTTGVTVAFRDTEGGSDGSGKSFGDMRTYELKVECKKRALPDTGDRDEMLAHLELHTDEAEDV
eukprot:COSAG02_NODE_251_length_27002_cov_13.799242_6_plen_414_part_00